MDGRAGDDLLEVTELAGSAAKFEGVRVLGRAADGDPGRVVAAVLQAAQAFNDDFNDGLRTDVTDNSAHGV